MGLLSKIHSLSQKAGTTSNKWKQGIIIVPWLADRLHRPIKENWERLWVQARLLTRQPEVHMTGGSGLHCLPVPERQSNRISNKWRGHSCQQPCSIGIDRSTLIMSLPGIYWGQQRFNRDRRLHRLSAATTSWARGWHLKWWLPRRCTILPLRLCKPVTLCCSRYFKTRGNKSRCHLQAHLGLNINGWCPRISYSWSPKPVGSTSITSLLMATWIL